MNDNQPQTGRSPAATGATSSSTIIVACTLLFCVVFLLSWSVTIAWHNRAYITELFYQSSLEKYNVATGESGPVTFRVYHTDYSALEKMVLSSDEIMGVEPTADTGVAAMAFTSIRSTAIERVRQHPTVQSLLKKNIPMLCH